MKRLEGAAAQRGSELLHHLLNQSLSGLDFCILWQSLVQECPELAPADSWVRRFLETADLSSLDRAFAALPEPEEGVPLPGIEATPVWREGWDVASFRMRDVTRLELRCQACGWEIDFSMEHPANTEMRLPFSDLECPLCSDEMGHPENSRALNQG